jgi:pimeloyl-ACP methyl ester carboxylesterase
MPTQLLPTGITMYYEVHGAGEPVVFIPGTGFAGDVWMPFQVPALSKSCQVIIFDPRGVGRTTHYEGIYTIEQQACDVACLLEHLGIPQAHILGHSMGGRVGLQLALDFPGRAKSLIMAASGSGAVIRVGEQCVGDLSYRWVLGLPGMDPTDHHRHSIKTTNNYFTADYRAAHPDKVAEFAELVALHHAEWPEELRQIMGRDTWEATHRLGDLRVPTMIMVGDCDTENVNHWAQSLALRERLPHAEFRVLEGQSHGFFWQAPDETNAVILDWVTRHL